MTSKTGKKITSRKSTAAGSGKDDVRKQKNQVTVRFIIKEAQYLMKCGRYQQAVISINRVLKHLPRFGLDVNELLPRETMKPYTQVLSG